jgi:hypothetical protein
LAKRPDVKLIVIDPIASFIGRCRIDDHKQSELRRVLDPLSELAEKTGAAIIVVAHLNKTASERAVYRIAGSVGYTAAVRLAYLVGADPDDNDRRFLLPVKMNLLGVERQAAAFRLERLSMIEAAGFRAHPALAELSDTDFAEVVNQMARVKFEANVDATADNVMGKPTKKDPNKVAKCAEWIKVFLAEYAYPSQEILVAARADPNHFTFDNVKEAKAKLKAEGLRNSNQGRFRGVWWSGFGDPRGWRCRPEPASAASTPLSPDTPRSPHTPHSGEREEETVQTGERRETGESGETGETRESEAKPRKGKRKTSTRSKRKRLKGRGDDRDTIGG